MDNKITVFSDFDGVLFDTLKEAFVLCRKVSLGIDYFEPIDETLYLKFYRYKYLVFNSWQFYYLIHTIVENINASDSVIIKEYNSKISNRDLAKEDFFEKEFLSGREYLLAHYPNFVDTLETKFAFFDMLMSLKNNENYKIIIVSRKNNFAIKRRLFVNGVEGIDIVGKEELSNVVNKSEFINKYIIDNNITKAYFIDDNSHNLKPCSNISNLICLLAGWGNISIDEKGHSQQEVFDIIQG